MLYVLSLILFTLAATRTEFPGLEQDSGATVLLCDISQWVLFAVLFVRFRLQLTRQMLVTSSSLAALFLATTISGGVSPFVIMGTAAVAVGSLLALSINVEAKNFLVQLIDGYLVLSVVSLAIAWIILFSTGIIYDVHHAIFPWSASRAADYFGTPRLTGLHVEPGSYSNTIYIIVFLRALLTRRIIAVISVVAILSTLVTFAAWSVIGVGVFVLAAMLSVFGVGERVKKVRTARRYTMALVVIGVVAVIVLPFLPYFMSRFSAEGGGSTLDKDMAIAAWLSRFPGGMIFPKPMGAAFCNICLSEQDLGLIFNLVFHFGIPLTLCTLFIFCRGVWLRFGPLVLLLSLAFFLSKIFYFDPLVWVCLTLGSFPAPYMNVRRSLRPPRETLETA